MYGAIFPPAPRGKPTRGVFYTHIACIAVRKSNQLKRRVLNFAESIGRLEQRKSTLADCLIEILRIFYRLQRKQKTLDQDFLSHVKKVVNLRYNQYVTGYHVLALYLHPSGKDLFHSSSVKNSNGILSTLIPTMKK
eukprot:gb/GECG01014964.1/.p1 GENE.gb/GECG01014964.1/~~gb/GECG01014964.1/.p1  ORF type:complete len:136 (+),score=7.81 gb/GECG01014964.1/:1-408(+)